MSLRCSYEQNLPHMRTDGVKCLKFLFPYSLPYPTYKILVSTDKPTTINVRSFRH